MVGSCLGQRLEMLWSLGFVFRECKVIPLSGVKYCAFRCATMWSVGSAGTCGRLGVLGRVVG